MAISSTVGTPSPTNADEVLAAVQEALAQEAPLEIRGGGTKRGWGGPVKSNRVLDLSGLRGVTLYEPDELVLSARAGTPLDEVEALLAENKQMLAFEPPDLATIYGLPSPRAPQKKPLISEVLPSGVVQASPRQTLGGVIACNLSGPRRIKAGAARDHFLGVKAVSGRGEAFKAGGRVMKNVTGYDLPKLLCGSFGTLAVMTDITVKVLPAPEKSRTVLVLGLDARGARDAMAAALNSPHEVSGAAYLPAAAAARSAVSYVRSAGRTVTAIRVEGFAPSVAARCKSLREMLAPAAAAPLSAVEELHTMNSSTLWREVRDVAALLPEGALDLWRLSVPPAACADIVGQVGRHIESEGGGYVADWGGGLIWMAVASAGSGFSDALRAALAASGGHATLVRGSAETYAASRRALALTSPVAALSRRLREAFDPKFILNPGRIAIG